MIFHMTETHLAELWFAFMIVHVTKIYLAEL